MDARLVSILKSAAATFALGICAVQTAGGVDVDLSTSPLVSGLSKVVPPNIFFILDDSGSMANDYMPDSVNGDNNKNCFRNWGYNKIYYNPNVTYTPPLKADGSSYPNATYTAAKNDGYSTGGGTTDLSRTTTTTVTDTVTVILGDDPFSATNGDRTVVVTSPAHGLTTGTRVTISGATNVGRRNVNGNYTITVIDANHYSIEISQNARRTETGGGSGVRESHDVTTTVTRNVWFYTDYTADPSAPPDTCQADNAYTVASPTTIAQQQNVANWFSYYRTRILMMKTASGRAFATIGDKYRVGFTAISEKGTNTARFLNIKKFDATQKASWYTLLYAQDASGYTPLRGALSKAGRLYAGSLITGNDDPVQYSCQQNFTILTTDGYWNTQNESPANNGGGGNASSNYGPYRENNTTRVGNADSGLTAPYGDTYTDTLADVAMYYYKTDLRPTGSIGGLPDGGTTRLDVSTDNVPIGGTDTANWQHMTLFGIGLGVAGTLDYSENYLNGGSPSYNAILQGTPWPNPNTTSTATDVDTRIDDLWHAAVNGRGQYLSASNPDSVVSALSKTLAAISVTNASAAAAATSSLEPVAGDNFAYVAQYTTGLWYGDLQARDINLTTGALSATASWSAQGQLATKITPTSDTRSIYTFSTSSGNNIKSFVSANLTAEKTANYFKSNATNPGGKLLQYDLWTPTQQTTVATQDAMIGFIRGQNGLEDESTNANRLFRDRSFALGDIVDSSPVFVRKPPFKYADTGYAAYVTSQANRTAMVYVGANDGMLHAFNAQTGDEVWAYIPSEVIPNLYKLADAGYANNHQFFVDGPITVGDAYDSSAGAWKTVLIAGLGRGGTSYVALDVSNPANPKALWEFGSASCTQCSTVDNDMGYSYGNAVLTKRSSDSRWVVLFASGYNNTGGDSKGRLYVVDAFSGAKLDEIITDNTVTDPNLSGIAKINNFVTNTLVDNSTQYVYGGDLGGSLWRFDLTARASARLGRTPGAAGDQPITVRPEIGRVQDNSGTYNRVVYFGTGRYLGLNDLTSTSTSTTVPQAFYGVKDTGANVGDLTSVGANLVAQTLDASVNPRTIPNPAPVDWSAKNGWYVTLPVGERVNVDPRLQLGSLVAVSNIPKEDYCTVGGTSLLYVLDYKTGAAVYSDSTMQVGFQVGSSLATGLTLVRLPNGQLIAIVTEADTTVRAMDVRVASGVAGAVRRLGWRELN
jgi:type IV pilus assembly protein PilY1